MTTTGWLILKWLAILIIVPLVFYKILKYNYIIGGKRNIHKAKQDTLNGKKSQKFEKFFFRFLNYCSVTATTFGLQLSEVESYSWKFRLLRMPLHLKKINHDVTAKELVGFIKLFSLLVFIIALTMLFTSNVLGILFLVISLSFRKIIGSIYDFSIRSFDLDLESDFADFYLAIHPQLLRGTNAKLNPVVQEYQKTLLTVYTKHNDHKAIKEFVKTFLHLLSINKTEVSAISLLRERYTCSDVATFCNYAQQAMRGDSNEVNLMSFQMNLMSKRKAAIRLVGQRRAEIAQYAVYSIFIILFEIVLVSIGSKLNFSTEVFTFLKH